ncbi:MAG: hypothetical protein ACE5H1_12655 [Thermodesulfobacteriota bacterium]
MELDAPRWICLNCGEIHGFFQNEDKCSVCQWVRPTQVTNQGESIK